MRISFSVVAAAFAAVLSLPSRAVAAAAVPAPCTKAVTACERWLVYGKGPSRSMFYASYPLDRRNAGITRALIMVHGAGRNADHYFETSMAAAFLAGALDNTIVIAPHFIAAPDKPQANEVMWPERGDTWRSGGMSPTDPNISAFDFVDELIRKLADKTTFPNLASVVVAGHSAGGQFATRYEMATKVDPTPGVRISYVVANPSSYAWPAAVRPLHTGNADSVTAHNEALGKNGEKVNGDFSYGPFDAALAPGYDQWPSGLEGRKGYTANMSDDLLRKNLVSRTTTYLLGQVDVLPLGGFDSSPKAMAQGPTRRSRGEAFFKYITDSLGAKQQAIIVPECGHNDRCIYTTDVVFPVIFPK